MKLTTTFNKLKLAGACGQTKGSGKGYDKLADYLVSASDYGKDKPINLLTILESNGVDDCLWCLKATIEDSKIVSVKIVNKVADLAVKRKLEDCKDPEFIVWANKWLSGEDRSEAAARAARVAEVAEAVAWVVEAACVAEAAWVAEAVCVAEAAWVARVATRVAGEDEKVKEILVEELEDSKSQCHNRGAMGT